MRLDGAYVDNSPHLHVLAKRDVGLGGDEAEKSYPYRPFGAAIASSCTMPKVSMSDGKA